MRVTAPRPHYVARGTITPDERLAVQQYFLLPFNRQLFDCHICLVSSPEVAMKRELARALTKKHGETMNPQTLHDLLTAHHKAWARHGCDADTRMAWHNSSRESEAETAAAILEKVLAAFSRRLNAEK